jgi:hypothetical protein
MAPSYRSYETFPGTTEQITKACLQAIQECRFSVQDSSVTQGHIRARARINFRSWGENITVTVGTNGNTEIVSESWMPITTADWGKNRANVNKLFSIVRSALASRTRAAD